MPPKLLDSKCWYAETPNTGDKRRTTSLIVVHYTATDDYHSSVQWFLEKRAKASAHLVIGMFGETCQLAPLDVVTWHSGQSYWKDQPTVNSFSVGIELVNLGPLLPKPDSGGYVSVSGSRVIPEDRVYAGKHRTNRRCQYEYWHTYPEKQQARLRDVIAKLRERYPEITDVVGHSDVAPGRKLDPGPALPVDQLSGV